MQIESEGHDRIYCYERSNVLINKPGIRDSQRLADYERKKSSMRLLELAGSPARGNLDYKHLKKIHKAIFQDIYEWAGKERTVDIAKSNLFCRAMFLNDMASDIFRKYAEENYLLGCTKKEICERLAFYLGEINALHPFREGNGRSQREFIRCAAAAAGYELNWSCVEPEAMMEASIESFSCRYSGMIQLLQQSTRQMSYREQLQAVEQIADKKGPLGRACREYFKKIQRISSELKKEGYPVDDKIIRGIERLEKLSGREIKGREFHHFRPESDEAGKIWGQLKKFMVKVEVLER
ncbi:Fic/DOC family protein [Candidatus Acetatifactor stercoripullorum]|uniref:Fic/DOC family protein n=1 Tax=Candidatus Acetatifactor stercoripullorum TaxID=2838414 RepID=UPI00298DB53D|nr:Fic family protein [Candidatus Acetatifactor stercoripullorum]